MKKFDLIRAWGGILTGHHPMLSIEITRECPLRCPGCYAYEPDHLGQVGPLRSLIDHRGEQLIERVLDLVRRLRPIHLSIVGGEPLVRFRELDILLPRLNALGIEVQLVTSAVREIPAAWSGIQDLHIVVSVDGLQPDHDRRRAPATYERILRNIKGHSITVHCTITRQMTGQPDYFERFLDHWSGRPEVRKIWFSLFTPQKGAEDEEVLRPAERALVLDELELLRSQFPKLDLPDVVLAGLREPPQSPEQCIFARTTLSVTADLHSKITPCQFGGDPDCAQCGCVASAGFKAIGDYRLGGLLPLRSIYNASDWIGRVLVTSSDVPEA
jgi:MoaA/NifB/PqqE/SkfB family radical SAM enzyme